MGGEIFRLNRKTASQTIWLETGRGEWNCRCKGEICGYRQERLWGSRLSGPELTLRDES